LAALVGTATTSPAARLKANLPLCTALIVATAQATDILVADMTVWTSAIIAAACAADIVDADLPIRACPIATAALQTAIFDTDLRVLTSRITAAARNAALIHTDRPRATSIVVAAAFTATPVFIANRSCGTGGIINALVHALTFKAVLTTRTIDIAQATWSDATSIFGRKRCPAITRRLGRARVVDHWRLTCIIRRNRCISLNPCVELAQPRGIHGRRAGHHQRKQERTTNNSHDKSSSSRGIITC